MAGRAMRIKGDLQVDLEALVASWHGNYPTENLAGAKLVQEAANSEWILFRVQRLRVDNLAALATGIAGGVFHFAASWTE